MGRGRDDGDDNDDDRDVELDEEDLLFILGLLVLSVPFFTVSDITVVNSNLKKNENEDENDS